MAGVNESDLFVALYPFKTKENNQLSLQKGEITLINFFLLLILNFAYNVDYSVFCDIAMEEVICD